MGLLDKLWDDVVAGPVPSDHTLSRSDHTLSRFRRAKLDRITSSPPSEDAVDEARRRMMDRSNSGEYQQRQQEAIQVTKSLATPKPSPLRTMSLGRDGSASSPPTGASPPLSPSLASPGGKERENVWRSVFHPGSNHAMKKIGSDKFDKAQPNSPTVYDWLYSGETKSSWR